MAEPSALAHFISDRLEARGESITLFAARAGINSSGLYKLLRGAYDAPQQRTLEKIARALDMTAAELLLAAAADEEADPFEQAIRQRTAEMRAAVSGAPRVFWPLIIRSTFDRAIDSARDMARLLQDQQGPLSGPPEQPVSRRNQALTGESNASRGGLGTRLPHLSREPSLAAA